MNMFSFSCKGDVCCKLPDGICVKEKLECLRDNCWQRLTAGSLISEDMFELLVVPVLQDRKDMFSTLLTRYVNLVSTKYPVMGDDAFSLTPANDDEMEFITTGKMKWLQEQKSMNAEDRALIEVAEQFLLEVR